MGWTVEYAVSVRKSFEKIDSVNRRRIRSFLEERLMSMEDPRQLGKPLSGPMGDLWRYRVGDFRVICELEDRRLKVVVVKVDHRKEVYR